MSKHPVILIAFEEFDNLGMGYLSSVLSDAGYDTRVIDFSLGKEEITDILRRYEPLLIGISIIYQFFINDFRELAESIRGAGIKCHLTAGGQYPSLRFRELFDIIPQLDSAVRFDGEYTLLDLVKCISSGEDWKKVDGIAYRENEEIIATPLRIPEADLDKFPLPMRSPLKEYALGRKFSTILAGRGCIYNCSFCNTREYVMQSGGKYKRIRNPALVAEEMELLHKYKDCTVFLFQDDDFPVRTGGDSEWVDSFCSELMKRGLSEKIMWKINCRPDEVETTSFSRMKENGLFLVYLGIEEGTDNGLKRLNKGMTVSKCLSGVNTLRKLNICLDYGFMLFQPSATFNTIYDNLIFLEKIGRDGYTPVTFHKMMPFFDTPVEKELFQAGRIKGVPGFYDYDFLDENLNQYHDFVAELLKEWLLSTRGLLNVLKWARNYLSVYTRFYGASPESRAISASVRAITAESNLFLLGLLREMAGHFGKESHRRRNKAQLTEFRRKTDSMHDHCIARVNDQMKLLLLLAGQRH